jgi:hypothetical protein
MTTPKSYFSQGCSVGSSTSIERIRAIASVESIVLAEKSS